jgi:polyphosphate kinase
MAGVKVDLIVRDTCRLRPGISGLSDNIRVISVVGRFLEHARIYYFRNGGADDYYIASADAMKRNLEARVEVLCPIDPPELKKEFRNIFDTHLSDQCSAWDMQSDGSYLQRIPGSETQLQCGSHYRMIARTVKRLKESLKQKKKMKTK